MSQPTVKTYTLGCKVNQYETEFVREGLVGIGYRDAEPQEPADLCVVNTCTVTGEADAKSRQAIRRLARQNPHARIVVMGCYATRAPHEVAQLPGVAEVVTDKREIPDLLGRFGVVDIPTGISQFRNRHRAYVKLQDGCMLRCSYCIIPHVRPQLHSRAPEHVLAEVERLISNGYREIVLTGIHLGHYGVDLNIGQPKSRWIRLSSLLEKIAELTGDFRVRLSSIEATEVTRELLAVMAGFPRRICPHLHICLQSGSDEILRRMKRRWGAKRFLDRCLLVKKLLELPALTTDVIVGFPGETERDFEATCRVVREVGFSKTHVFPFSPRRGTAAADMPHQVPNDVKTARSRALIEIESELRKEYFSRLTGKSLRIIVESPLAHHPGQMVGTACRYAPIQLPASPTVEPGRLVDVVATLAMPDRIVGQPLLAASSSLPSPPS
jgi:threonylcarbamoyladenosine tRNA methylthiotransferase MtaB